MEFRILGPLEVLDDQGRPLALGGPKQRALLAVLLLDAGAVVSADRLVDELWGEDPPVTARGVLQVYVANLRKVLEPGRATRAAGTLLRTQPPGYLLDLGGHGFDLAAFERLLARGREAMDAGDPAGAAAALREALGRWRGPALGDVAGELRSPGSLARLEEQRLAALEQRIEADLALGRHAGLVGELESLVAAHPLRERLRGQLMVALYRCGRQAEALEEYRRARETLAEELGIDPSRPLQDLERAVLAQDPALDWTSAPAQGPPGAAAPEPPASPSRARAPAEERKVVTVLSCDLAGAAGAGPADPEDARARLRPYLDQVRAEVERFGGTVERSLGHTVLATFGAPAAHEDDPERAVRAALRILEVVEEQNRTGPGPALSPRVGVGTGEALVALRPGSGAGEGPLAGAVVDTAARLAALAPAGGVVVDEATRRSTSRAIAYREQDPAGAAGRWLATAARSRHGAELRELTRTPFVGREDELAVLGGLYRRAVRERSVQLVTVTGEPGVGKSRLVRELFAFVDAQPELVAWRQGRCLPYGDGITFWALGEIVKAEAGILESDGPGEAAAKLAAAVEAVEERPGERRWLADRLAPLAGLAGPGQAATQPEEAFAAWRQFLEGVAARHPLVLIMEDLHWADAALLAFLQHLAEWATEVPMMVVGTARPDLAERWAGWGAGARNATTIALPPLTDAQVTELGAALLDQALLPSELQALLVERAGGNPLYAEELLRLLADQGLLTRRGRTVRLARDAEVPVPDTVQALIAGRLDTLAPDRKALLQDAAVVGQVFWSGALAAMGELDEAEVRAGLHELARRELLRPSRRSSIEGQAEYGFWHILVRDVAYGQLPRAARADRHRRAAEWLEALAPDRAGDRAELLAHHWLAACRFAEAAGQDPAPLAERARRRLREAGDRAFSLNSFAAAARWYAAALDLWPAGDPERPRLLLALGEARLYADSAGGDLLAEARDGLLAAGDRERAAEAEARLSTLASWQGRYEQELEHARRAVALLEDSGPSAAKAVVLANLANTLMFADDHAETVRVGRQALAIAERLGLDVQRVRALMPVGLARVAAGDRGGVEDLERAVEIAVGHNLAHQASAYGNLAAAVIPLGELARGFRLQAAGREAAERFGLASTVNWLRSEQVLEHYWQGRWPAALAAAERRLAEAEAGSPADSDILCRLARGWIRLARGDLAGAAEDAAAAVAFGRSTGFVDLAPSLALSARALLAAGRDGEADQAVAELLALLADRGARPTAPDWSGPLAVVLLARGRGPELAGLLGRAPVQTPWFQAAAAIAAGAFDQAAGHYAAIGARPEEASARLRAAVALQAAGRRPEADAQLERAVRFFRQVGARAHLREAEALGAAPASSA